MAGLGWVADNLGLTVLTVVAVALTAYLVYVMVHPERF
jgi:K+-transporting ATPase KdpF subunit